MSSFTNKRVIPVATLILLLGTAAYASSVHFKTGPTFTDNGTTLTMSGALAGLGNGDITVTLIASGTPSATCTNQGGNAAPGQNPATVTTSGSETIPSGSLDKNGNLTIPPLTTNPPIAPSAGQPGFACANGNWTETITNVAFTSAEIQVQQGGQIVLDTTCTFAQPTTGGQVPKNQVSCTP